MNVRRYVAIALAGTLALSGASMTNRLMDMGTQVDHLTATAAKVTAQTADVADESAELADARDDLRTEVDANAAVLEQRTAFVERVAEAAAALDGAGSIDATAFRDRVLAAQDAVLAAGTADDVTAQAEAVAQVTAEIAAAVEAERVFRGHQRWQRRRIRHGRGNPRSRAGSVKR